MARRLETGSVAHGRPSQIAAQVAIGLNRPPSPRPNASLSFSSTQAVLPGARKHNLRQSSSSSAASTSSSKEHLPTKPTLHESTSSTESHTKLKAKSSAELKQEGKSPPTAPLKLNTESRSPTSDGPHLPKKNTPRSVSFSSAWASKAKLWGASRAASAAPGLAKAVAEQFLGIEGSKGYAAVLSAIKNFYGDSDSHAFEKDSVTLFVKVKMLFDDGLISIDQVHALREVLYTLILQIESNLSLVCNSDTKFDLDLKPLLSVFAELEETLVDSFQEVFKPRNLAKLKLLLDKLKDPKFLKDFYLAPENKKAREEALEAIRKVMRMTRTNLETQLCRYPSCKNRSLLSQETFQTCGFCAAHHIEHFAGILASPEIDYFLFDSSLASGYFREYLSRSFSARDTGKATLLTCFDLIGAIQRWKQVQSHQIKIRSARSIAKAFLCDKSWDTVKLPEEIDMIIDELFREEGVGRLPSDYFDPLCESMVHELVKGAFPGFLVSQEFKKFCEATTLVEEESRPLAFAVEKRKSTLM